MLPFLDPDDTSRYRALSAERGGYSHQAYACSLTELGTIIELEKSGARLLRRRIPGSHAYDCIGCYPLFTCERPRQLGEDLRLVRDTISTSVVTDPWSGFSPAMLAGCFDFVRPFKTHYAVDLTIPFGAYLHRHHRRYAKRALSVAPVSMADNPAAYAEEWVRLYQHLIERHCITGPAAFSPRSLALQLEVPGCHYFRAVLNGEVQAALVCFLDRGVAFAHLISTTAAGQEEFLQYALYWSAIEAFRGSARWFSLGSTPGLTDGGATSGLGFFKAGWSTHVCKSFFCGRIDDPDAYSHLSPAGSRTAAGYFPAYRFMPERP
jgi:hypothetical protein